MAGANLSYMNRVAILRQIMKKLSRKANSRLNGKGAPDSTSGVPVSLCMKAGAPASNTAADSPNGSGELCYDTTNDDLYLSSSWVSTTSHTWTKIVD